MTNVTTIRAALAIFLLIPGMVLCALGVWPLGITLLVSHWLSSSCVDDYMRIKYPKEVVFMPVYGEKSEPAHQPDMYTLRGKPRLHLVK